MPKNIFVGSALFFAVQMLASLSQASTSLVENRTYFQSCGYYSRTMTDFKIQYTNPLISPHSKVVLIHALSGVVHQGVGSTPVEWFGRTETLMEPSTSPSNTWTLEISRTVHERTSPYDFSQLVFVFKIVDENNNETWDIGSPKPWSFYQSNVNREYVQCSSTYPVTFEYKLMPVKVIERN